MAKEKPRGYVRVDDILKVDYRKISYEHYKKCESKPEVIFKNIFGEPIKVPEIEGGTEGVDLELLYNLIYQANLKIDRILDILERKDAERYASVGSEWVNISGSGMRFIVNQRFSSGDIIAFKVFLPLASRTWINVLGKVMSVTEVDSENKYSTAVKFIDLPEVDREMIIRYVFQRQRELLRLGSDVKIEKDQIVD
ncbi:MAG: PilZ domain-containing protein [Deltaproteobacteria bacterium]|nr:PilZ domain-containing protein [Deltaproteobacteria bacterium]